MTFLHYFELFDYFCAIRQIRIFLYVFASFWTIRPSHLCVVVGAATKGLGELGRFEDALLHDSRVFDDEPITYVKRE